MTLSTFELSPAAVIGVRDADIGIDEVKDSTVPVPAQFAQSFGKLTSGKFETSHALFCMFDVDIPAGATIAGVELKLTSTGAAVGLGGSATVNSTGGLIDVTNLGSDDWEDANGVEEWATQADIPFAQWDEGASTDASVWYGGAPAWSDVPFPISQTQFQVIGWGDGLGTWVDVPGLRSQMAAYLAASESYRGHRVAGAIPVCFQIIRPWTSQDNNYQTFYTQNWQIPKPQLLIEWDLPPAGVSGEVELSAAVSGGADLLGAVSGEVSVVPAVSGVASIQ